MAVLSSPRLELRHHSRDCRLLAVEVAGFSVIRAAVWAARLQVAM